MSDLIKEITREDFDKKDRKVVFKHGQKQVLLLENNNQLYALDNRCPHEGYPLAEGDVNDQSAVLTCNWHNWKFDLNSGRCLIGGDNVRTYPVVQEHGFIKVDLSDPSPEQLRDMITEGLSVAYEKRQYGRIARELARYEFSDIDPLYGVRKAIEWSHDKFEYGMTHAFAACADWMALYQRNIENSQLTREQAREQRIICLTEAIEHIAHDALRYPAFAFSEGQRSFNKDIFLAAVESEDEQAAIEMVRGGHASGMRFRDFEHSLATAALNHYNDFGHTLIYVYKASFLAEFFDNPATDLHLLLTLTRSLIYTTREDLIPEFSEYRPSLERLQSMSFGTQDWDKNWDERFLQQMKGLNVKKSYLSLLEFLPEFTSEKLYQHLLILNAQNFLSYDLTYQDKTTNPVTQNVGWLDFTHGLTFSNAVRAICQRYPDLWKKGLLQMASFYGRNSAYTSEDINPADWSVENLDAFESEVEQKIYDHGMPLPIFSAHVLKTSWALFEERRQVPSERLHQLLYAGLNRFLNSPLKAKHVRRQVHQGISLVKKDF